MSKILFRLAAAVTLLATPLMSFATTDFSIIPESKEQEPGKAVDCVAGKGEDCKKGTVRDRYNAQAEKYDGTKDKNKRDIGACFATGIFSWNCVIDYIVYGIRFLSEVGILVGAGMIIYAGYKYATAVFSGKSPGNDMVKNAIIGVLVIIFSYAIVKILTAAFL